MANKATDIAEEDKTVFKEVVSLFNLSVPLAITSLSWVGMATTDTAVVGHLGTRYLSAAAMADLWTSSTGVFISGGVLGFFCGRSIGAGQPRMAGIWLQVSLCVLSVVAVAVMVSWICTGQILRAMGESAESSGRSMYYATILAVAIPARVGLGQVSQFYQAQKITGPSLKAGLFSMVFNATIQVVCVLGIGLPFQWSRMGWPGLPVVTASTTYFQLLLFTRIAPDTPCWGGWKIRKHVTFALIKEFSVKYFPAALSSASDWWRVVAIGVVAASLGEVDLAVFNSSYRILWMCLIISGSIATATGIKISVALGSGDIKYAKRITTIGVVSICPILVCLSLVVIKNSDALARIFSHDPEVIALYNDIRWSLAGVVIAMNMSVVFERIALSMGRSSLVLGLGFVGSWLAQVPLVIVCTKFWRNDLVGLYTGVALGYTALDIMFIYALFVNSSLETYNALSKIETDNSVVLNPIAPNSPRAKDDAPVDQDEMDSDSSSHSNSTSFV